MKNLLILSKYVRGSRKNLIVIALISILYAITNSIWPQFIRWVVNNASNHFAGKSTEQNIVFIIIITSILLAIGLLLGLLDGVGYWYTDRTSSSVETNLNKVVYSKLQDLSVSFYENNLSGSLQQKIYSGISAFQDWIMTMSQNLLEPGAIIIISTIFIFISSPLVGTIVIVGTGIFIINFMKAFYKSRPLYEKVNKNVEQINGRINETFSNISTIRTMSSENQFRKIIYKLFGSLKSYNYKLSSVWGISLGTRSALNRTVLFISLGVMLFNLSSGKSNVGDIILVIIYLEQVQRNLLYFSRFFTATINNENKAKRLVEFMATKPDFEDETNAINLNSLQSYSLEGVGFDYPDGKKGALEDISLTIAKGKTVALVGPSGVGKSTITKLLLRFYLPTKGVIKINDQEASTFTQESIRKHIGVVMQDVALFNDTILNNLQIASPKATRSQITSASKQAHCDEFIKELPNGYDTLVGNRGIKLSGGQKQRIAIARAILKNPQLIILDEATSALDSQSEKLVQDGLKKLLRGRSALIIAHRLSTVQHADEIIVLEKGGIKERGTHRELMDKPNGLYRKLFELQSSSGKIVL